MLGCTNPSAVNYNPAATEDNGSCIYLIKIGDKCMEFGDAPDTVLNKSFTLSYDTIDKQWSFMHDYWPDMYFHTRRKLYNVKHSKLYEHNAGPRGLFHDRTKPAPFFIDVLFREKGESVILNNVKWISEVRSGGNREADDNSAALYNETITAITIYNNYQCTGRIVLDKTRLPLADENNRNSLQEWSFNDFRNIAKDNIQFLDNIFNDFKIIPSAVQTSMAWYNRELMEGKYFIVRFEFDNNNDKQITLHDMAINADKAYRAQ